MKRSEKAARCMVILCTLLLCSGAANAADITVSAAMSLKGPFEEIGKIFEAGHRGAKVYFNFAASGMLEKQIEGGAPVDIFASASASEMDMLEQKGLIIKAMRRDFAGNSIVLIVPDASPVTVQGLKDLGRKDVKRIAIGNPSTAPVGKYAEEVLRSARLWDVVQAKMVFAETVRQVMDYVARQEADAGMVFLSDALAGRNEVKIVWEAPEGSHSSIRYVIAPIKGTAKGQLAHDFVETVLSEKGEGILKRYGFRKVRGN